jgi:23S rRNA pseudouridine2605 synthase
MDVRLNKLLGRSGAASRRKADDLIRQGRVSVNGVVVTELGTKVDDRRDRISVDGRAIPAAGPAVHILLHKPAGFLVTLSDPFGRPTILDLLPGLVEGVRPVGRLDMDSEGVLLLTNDGEMAYRLTHPRYEIRKTYVVRVKGEATAGEAARLAKGIFVEGRRTAPARVEVLEAHPGKSVVRITIHEGRKREVRRMFEAVGHEVAALKRTDFAGITLDHLPLGKWRSLKPAEVAALRRKVGLG